MDERLFLTLKEIDEKLKGINWILISGIAVKIYAYPDRKVNDIDILIPYQNEFLEASKRLGKEVEKRHIDKEKFKTSDMGFELVVSGFDIEITGGMWEIGFKDFISRPKFDEEWLKRVQERDFFGLKLRLQPLESLIVQKIAMGREKDKTDLEYLMKLDIDTNFLKRESENWNCYKKVLDYIKEHRHI